MIYDMRSAEFLNDPYDVFRRMLKEAPVCRSKGIGEWAVAPYNEVKEIYTNARFWSSKGWIRPGKMIKSSKKNPPTNTSMVAMDPPEHTRLRRIVAPVFTPRKMAAFAPVVQGVVDNLMNNIMAKDEFDFVKDFSMPLPMTVISLMLGVGEDKVEEFKSWSDLTFNTVAVTFMEGEERRKREALIMDAARKMNAFLREKIAEKQQNPGDDLMSLIVHAKVDGESLEPREVLTMCTLLMVAGNETTQNAIGNMLLILRDQPEMLTLLRENPEKIDGFINECLRINPPVYGAMRRPAEDIEVCGTVIPKHGRVFALSAAANHDPSVFQDPSRFDPDRDNRKSMPFGWGVHICLGKDLALLEMKLGLQALLPELERMSIGPNTWLDSVMVRGPGSLPIIHRRRVVTPGARDSATTPAPQP